MASKTFGSLYIKNRYIISWACLGTVFEYCDTCVFMLYAQEIARVLLPEEAAWSIYLIQLCAGLARPIGAYLVGLVGDKYGPIVALRRSAGFLALASFTIAIIPPYSMCGILSPILLCLARAFQMGFCGGELNFAALSLIAAMPKYKNLASGLAWACTSAGWLLASLFREVLGYGNWRIAFIFLSITGFLLHYAQPARGVLVVKRSGGIQGGELITFLLSFGVAAMTYYTQQYMVYGSNPVAIYAIALLCNLCSGYLASAYDRKSVMYVGLALSCLLLTINPQYSVFLHPIALSLWKSPTHAISHEMMPVKSICSRTALLYSLGTAIAGQGTMTICGMLDSYQANLSIIWPIFAGLLLFWVLGRMVDR